MTTPPGTRTPATGTITQRIAAAADDARALVAAADGAVAARLRDCVAGPLGSTGSGPAAADPDVPWLDRLRTLTEDVTRLCADPDAPVGVFEAAAALLDLAGTDPAAAPPGDVPATSERIQLVPDGPILLVGDARVCDHLGVAGPARGVRALCRCGESALKPTCDGACHRTGFSDAKDPNRVPDRRDAYEGQQVRILDNRGLCQHSGLCTDRLATVFHSASEPFVTPSGGRMDEIIRAVRDCPSGALGFALDGVEARGQVDHGGTRPANVEITLDGPYRVSGGTPLVDGAGEPVARNEGASLEHYALCRCGHSQNKPFCSGMHWYVGFRDPAPDLDTTPSIFAWAGGVPALTRMTRLFYEKYVPADPLLGPVFARMSADHPERVAAWLGEVFCGPPNYSQQYGGYTRMLGEHIGKHLTHEQRRRWVELLTQSAHDAGLPDDAEFRAAFGSYIEWGSRLAVENSQTESRPPQHMPMPHWDWSTAAGPPGSRVSALAPPSQEAETPLELPGDGEPVGFERHVKPLFRGSDRRSMSFVFDLWSAADVRTHGPAILGRLRDGTMPCDGAWPAERVRVFERWLTEGAAD